MRTKLGTFKKAPIEILQESMIRNLFGLFGFAIGLAIVQVGGNFLVDMLNYLKKNMSTPLDLEYNDPMVWGAKGVAAVIVGIIVFSRTK